MSTFNSDNYIINANSEKIFAFLSDFQNFGTLLPDGVKDWTATSDNCSFSIPNLATISLQMGNNEPNNIVRYETAEGGSPYKANITFSINQIGEEKCDVTAEFSAELNAMFAMLAKNPIKNFLKMAMERLQLHFK